MKTIYFVRHAKSSWADFQLADHDRPLNQRGKRDAPVMARRLLGFDVAPDGIYGSTAKRARRTAREFARVFDVPKDKRTYLRGLYHAYPDRIEREIWTLPPEWDTVLFFGHNPGYTDLANLLQGEDYIDNVPTCGIVGAQAAVDDWSDFLLAEARRTLFLYPKQTV